MKRLFLIVYMFLIPSIVMAASSRILPASYTEYTYDSAGGGEDYTALATWEADTDIDVSSTGQVLTCSSGIHNDAVILAGATTDSNGFRVIRAASGARGTPTNGVRFVVSQSAALNHILIDEHYARVHDIAVKTTVTGASSAAYSFVGRRNGIYFVGCTVYDTTTTVSTSNASGFVLQNIYASTSNSIYCINCIAMGVSSARVSGSVDGAGFTSLSYGSSYLDADTVAYIYNSTSINNRNGVAGYQVSGYPATTEVNIKNTISQGNSASQILSVGGTTIVQTTNATSGVTFAADGYHLDSTDTGAIGNGTDLSADGSFAFDDDIDGEMRDDWDIGADEYVASGARRRVIIVGD